MAASRLFNSETVAKAAFVKNLIKSSPEVSNALAPKDFIKVVVVYEDFTNEGPGGGAPIGGNPGYSVFALLEEEVFPGTWIGVGSCTRKVNTTLGQPKQHIIIYGPQQVSEEGNHNLFPSAGGNEEAAVNHYDAKGSPTNYRISIVQDIVDASRDQLSEITFSAYLELY